MTKSIIAITLFGFAALAGCAADLPEEDVDEGESAHTAGVNLKYEGTCEFLRNCSTYSRGLPQGEVMWGCTGRGACDDDGLWVAGPTRAQCGKTVRICKGSRCTNAVVKDVSVSRDWEASNGVLDALGLPHGLTSRCGGYGGGNVTVAVVSSSSSGNSGSSGGSTSSSSSSAPDSAPRPPARPDEDGACWSATLAKTMPELTCVQARSNGRWYQCKDGEWYRGGTSDSGPYGDCLSSHPLR